MKIEEVNLKELIENETGLKFNRANKICCQFHKEKTPSLSYDPKKNKWKCFGCGLGGNSIDFIKEAKGLNYVEACKYLGIELNEEYKKIFSEEEKIKGYIEYQLNKFSDMKDWELIKVYRYEDKNNNTLYFKAKFRTAEKKQIRQYSIDDEGKVRPKRLSEEVPYNNYLLNRSLAENKTIFIVEGEKDVDTLTYFGYKATSFKGFSYEALNNYNFSIFKNSKISVVGDTGQAGENYINTIKKYLFNEVKSFKIVELTGLKELGDNKDITDWFQAGNSKEDFEKSLYKTLDLKNKYELQQDHIGIYKTEFKSKKIDGEETKIENKIYITNFNVKDVKNIRFIDEKSEGIEINLITPEGEIINRVGTTEVFDDVKTFKNFLGTMALTFKGKGEDLSLLKEWINRYFIKEFEKVYTGYQFKNNYFITPAGAFYKDSIKKNLKCTANEKISLNTVDVLTNDDDVNTLIKNLFNVNTPENMACIIGTIINNLCYENAKANGVKLHHLFLIGESGSGKSTIKRNVINPILGYSSNYEGDAIDKITPFALHKRISEGNFTKIFDEFKPSSMSHYANDNITSTLRNLYDGIVISKGKKDLTVKEYKLTCPIIICGEEGIPYSEKASIERSLIAYFSTSNRPKNSTESLEWLKDNENLLNKLGNTIINHVLSMDLEQYKNKRLAYKEGNTFKYLKDRPLNTWINACVGMDILDDVLINLNVNRIEFNYLEGIAQTIKDNILNGGERANTIYESMLLKINDMVEGNLDYYRNNDNNPFIFIDNNETLLKPLILDELNKYLLHHGLANKFKTISETDFKKQCYSGGYMLSNATLRKNYNGKYLGRFYKMNPEKLLELGCYELIQYGKLENKTTFEVVK